MSTTATNPRRQDTAETVIRDFADFYLGSGRAWYRGITTSDSGRLAVTVDHPDQARGKHTTVELSAAELHEAFDTARRDGHYFCCDAAIREDSYGAGCADDIDLILQTAIFGEVIYN